MCGAGIETHVGAHEGADAQVGACLSSWTGPGTVDEAVDWLEAVLPDRDLELMAQAEADDLTGLRLALKMLIQERLFHPQNEKPIGPAGPVPDGDVSALVIRMLLNRLRARRRPPIL